MWTDPKTDLTADYFAFSWVLIGDQTRLMHLKRFVQNLLTLILALAQGPLLNSELRAPDLWVG